MPTLTFSDDFTASERKLYAKTFTHACKELKLTDFEATVMLVKESYANPAAKGCVIKLERDCFRISVSHDNDYYDGTFAMCHELVHIHQFARGDMDDHNGDVVWRGQLIPNHVATSQLFYLSLPWEKEAHTVGPKIHKRALRNLPSDTIGILLQDAYGRSVDAYGRSVAA